MGAWIAFHSRTGGGLDRFRDACRWIESTAGLDRVARVDGAASVAAFSARRHGAAELVRSNGAWMVVCGDFRHPVGDASAVLPGLLASGASYLDDAAGQFALGWFDPTSGRMHAAPDVFGRWHLFVAETADGTAYGTSSIALARIAGAEPDSLAVAEFLTCGTNYEERTPFLQVRRVVRTARAIVAGEGEPASAADIAVLTRAAIHDAVAPLKTPLHDLTGGLDSRLVVGFLAERAPIRDVTVTGTACDPDVASAGRLAERIGARMHRVDGTRLVASRSSFPCVLDAASLAEGGCDAIEYAGIAGLHLDHAAKWGASVNGSGGEMFRNYWWDGADLGRGPDPVERALPRFARPARRSGLTNEPLQLDPREHFRGVLGRACEPVRDLAAWRQLDHLYLALRMQCWQGSFASATNRIWTAASPLLESAPLRAIFRAPPEIRLGARLMYQLIAGFSQPFRDAPLESGYPPQDLSVANAWRFLPGLARAPGRFVRRVRRRLVPTADPALERAAIARGLRATGLQDWLDPRSMVLLPLLDRAAFDSLRDAEHPPLALLGRLISTEFALREASRAQAPAAKGSMGHKGQG